MINQGPYRDPAIVEQHVCGKPYEVDLRSSRRGARTITFVCELGEHHDGECLGKKIKKMKRISVAVYNARKRARKWALLASICKKMLEQLESS